MQKKIVALAVAGLSTAAFAQTNVTIYGVADLSGQGTTISGAKDPAAPQTQGSTFNVQSNSSLIGFKGTEDLGNGIKAMFQAETNLNMNGGSTGVSLGTSNSSFGALRDTFVGMSSKYGSGMMGYLSTPFRSSLNSFDVMPGATGTGQIENMMGEMRFGGSGLAFDSSVRATAVAYAMPTLYGFDASIAYTGSNNNGTTNTTSPGNSCGTGSNGETSACSATPQSAWGFNLGWTGYGVNLKGAFQQANYNLQSTTATGAPNGAANLGDFTSYLVGAIYTGLPGLKASAVYARNSLGTNGASVLTTGGAGKISNNQLYTGVSYRMGNWEPAVSAVFASDFDGSSVQQYGSRQWTARVGYYMSKRTQVYGVLGNVNNSANQTFKPGLSASASTLTGGQNLFTYGMGMRTTF
jgi:predicted porin